jgi:hypothetical protein
MQVDSDSSSQNLHRLVTGSVAGWKPMKPMLIVNWCGYSKHPETEVIESPDAPHEKHGRHYDEDRERMYSTCSAGIMT